MPAVAESSIEGLREFKAACAGLARSLQKELDREMARLLEPVRVSAEQRAVQNIENIGPRWFRMREGSTLDTVYIVPREHRTTGSRRPNLAGLLLREAMKPALDEAAPGIVIGIENMLGRVIKEHGL